jgi:hypothetical protein
VRGLRMLVSVVDACVGRVYGVTNARPGWSHSVTVIDCFMPAS